MEQVQKIIINGIKGYERRRKEDRDGSRMLHRTAGQSAGLRSRKKLLDKSEWFKTKRGLKSKDDMREEEDVPGAGCKVACSEVESKKRRPWKNHKKQQSGKSQAQETHVKTRTVLFVEQTRDGALAKDVREVLLRLDAS